jgi:hypothetical protein
MGFNFQKLVLLMQYSSLEYLMLYIYVRKESDYRQPELAIDIILYLIVELYV